MRAPSVAGSQSIPSIPSLPGVARHGDQLGGKPYIEPARSSKALIISWVTLSNTARAMSAYTGFLNSNPTYRKGGQGGVVGKRHRLWVS